MLALVALFFLTALAYASVGFGGGSTYTAILLLRDTDYTILPAISLTCNIIVVSGGLWRYSRKGLVKWRRLMPLCFLSVPMAWLGGRLLIPQPWFITLLALALLLSTIFLLLDKDLKFTTTAKLPNFLNSPDTLLHKLGLPILGGAIGFLSGIVGIGGGIFLAPALYLLRWGKGVHIAPACSVFIFVNSMAGLLGQVQKLETLSALGAFTPYWPLFPAVLVGGQIGTLIGRDQFNDVLMRRATGVLILVVVTRLLIKI